MFSWKRPGPAEWLVVGLGNPGPKYEWTRHNVGFLVIDQLADRENLPVQRLKHKALTNTALIGGKPVLLMKPTTYMNLSGEAVGEAARFYKIPPDRVLVISDDVSLPQGKLRVRRSGSAGGHNGLKNIIAHLGTDQFPRIKVGVDDLAVFGERLYDGVHVEAVALVPRVADHVDEGILRDREPAGGVLLLGGGREAVDVVGGDHPVEPRELAVIQNNDE